MRMLFVGLFCFIAMVLLICAFGPDRVNEWTEIRSEEVLVGTWYGYMVGARQEGTTYKTLNMIISFGPDGTATFDSTPLEEQFGRQSVRVSTYTYSLRTDGVLEIQPKDYPKREYRVMRSKLGAMRFDAAIPEPERADKELLLMLTFRSDPPSQS